MSKVDFVRAYTLTYIVRTLKIQLIVESIVYDVLFYFFHQVCLTCDICLSFNSSNGIEINS